MNAKETLAEAVALAPSDAKLFYNLALSYGRLGDYNKAIQTLEKTIEMKPNYKEARYALALFLMDEKEFLKAEEQLEYIVIHIDPNDELVKKAVEEINQLQ